MELAALAWVHSEASPGLPEDSCLASSRIAPTRVCCKGDWAAPVSPSILGKVLLGALKRREERGRKPLQSLASRSPSITSLLPSLTLMTMTAQWLCRVKLLHRALNTGLPPASPCCSERESLAHVQRVCQAAAPFPAPLEPSQVMAALLPVAHPSRGPTAPQCGPPWPDSTKTRVWDGEVLSTVGPTSLLHSGIQAEFLWAMAAGSLRGGEEQWALAGSPPLAPCY